MKYLAIIQLAIISALVWNQHHTPKPDRLVSPEMACYMTTVAHGKILGEGDMQ